MYKEVFLKIKEYNLLKEYTKFKKFLYSLGKVYDFSSENNFTNNKLNYNDPYHLNQEAYMVLFDEIFNPNSDFIVKN